MGPDRQRQSSRKRIDSTTPIHSSTSLPMPMLGRTHPHVAEMALAASHGGGLGGCDTDFEFEFALDVILDGLERLRQPA